MRNAKGAISAPVPMPETIWNSGLSPRVDQQTGAQSAFAAAEITG